MKNYLSILLLLLCHFAYPQRPEEDSVAKDLRRLASLKYQYEKLSRSAKYNPTKYLAEKEEKLNAYAAYTRKIKNNPDVYLRYIENEVKNPDLAKARRLPYNHFIATHDFNPDYYLITLRDFYLVVKYSLFEGNQDLLPEKLDDIPLIDRPGNVNPRRRLQTLDEIIVE
jgi:hypothetical protein